LIATKTSLKGYMSKNQGNKRKGSKWRAKYLWKTNRKWRNKFIAMSLKAVTNRKEKTWIKPWSRS